MLQENFSQEATNLFDTIFPKFKYRDDSQKVEKLIKQHPGQSYLRVQVENPIRFGGFGLPRGRYYCLDAGKLGDPDQTLAHELRAYRDPRLGLIEVLDLGSADGSILKFGDHNVEFEFESSILVLLHAPHSIPHNIDLCELSGFNGKVIKFPYRVYELDRVNILDLRHRESRHWFFSAFRTLTNNPDLESLIAHSEYHFEYAHRREPENFWDMLPTLLSPDVGGGVYTSSGYSHHVIAQRLRNTNVNGLIFPSARSDVFAGILKGDLISSYGWNFVDYSDAPKKILPQTDANSWSWLHFPNGITLDVSTNTNTKGSFRIDGVVNRSATKYLADISAVEKTHTVLGSTVPLSHEGKGGAAWLLGWLMSKEAELKYLNQNTATISEVSSLRRGAALLLGLEQLEGRFREINESVINARSLIFALTMQFEQLEKCIKAMNDRIALNSYCYCLGVGFLLGIVGALLTAEQELKEKGIGLNIPKFVEEAVRAALLESSTRSSFSNDYKSEIIDFLSGLKATKWKSDDIHCRTNRLIQFALAELKLENDVVEHIRCN